MLDLKLTCSVRVRYPNLDFGWKRSIDTKTLSSCPKSCSDEADCMHQSLTPCGHQGTHTAPCPRDGPCTQNLTNGTAVADDGHRDEHLQQPDSLQGCSSFESKHDTTSAPMQPPFSSSSPQPSHECTRANETTSDSEPGAPRPDLTVARDSPRNLGPNPGLILQALTLSNASDGFNLERLEMLGDSFLKHAITTYLFCTYSDAHEGRLSYMRSKKVRHAHYFLSKGRA